jgi:uracil-DNA glycosylase family 4
MSKFDDIVQLCAEYKNCQNCPDMVANRDRIVFGKGHLRADLMIIGEAPTKIDEEEQLPLVGDAGELLLNALSNVGLTRKEIYITNTVQCRPVTIEQGNRGLYKKQREPTQGEMDACRSRLLREIYIVDPKAILLLGARAASLVSRLSMQNIVSKVFRLKVPGKIPGNVITYPAVPTWHPSFIKRNGDTPLPGTYAKQFFEHVEVVAKIPGVGRKFNGVEL